MTKFHYFTMKNLFILFIVLIGTASATGELFHSKATLDVLGGFSSITDEQFDADPNLAIALNANIAGGFNSEYVTDSRVVTCYENGPALYDNLYASCLIFDVSGNSDPVVLGRINATGNVGVSNGAPSPDPTRSYVVRSFYEVKPVYPYYPYLTEFRLDVTGYDLNAGIFENTPRLNINFNEINPEIFTLTPAYTGLSGLSDDGRFAFYTAGVGTRLVSIPTPGGVLTFPVPFAQVYGILELSTDGRTYTKRVEIQANPAALPPPYISFTQGAQMRLLPDGSYLCVVAANTYAGLLDPLGKNAHIITYIFYPATNVMELRGAQPVPQYIQGFDLSPDNEYIGIVTNLALSKLSNDPRLPYPNVAPNKSDNARLYAVNQIVYNISLASTSSLFADGVQIRFGPKKTVFITQAPDLYDTIIPSPFPPNPALLLGTTVRIYSSNFLQTLIIKDNAMIPQTTAGIAPLSFGVAVNRNETRVFSSGTPTPYKKSEALFSVVRNN